ncbi:MAG TPA: hypothetical protein VF101_17145 [Gaiellaceae bacterium]
MAVGMLLDMPAEAGAMYEAVNQQMFGTSTPTADQLPSELILHSAGATAGGFRIFDVWESREAFERFFQGQVGPAMQALGGEAASGPPPEPQIYELSNWVRGQAG